MAYIIVISTLVVNSLISLVPAHFAKHRGYRFWKFWLIGFFTTFIIAVIVMLCNPDISEKRRPVPCTQCGRKLFPNVNKCPNCGADAPPPVYADKPPETPFKPSSTFVGDWLGILLMAAALAAVLIVGFTSVKFVGAFAYNFVFMLMPVAAIAMGIVLTARAKGADFSLPVLITLSGVVAAAVVSAGGHPAAAIAAALGVCLLIGAISSVLIVLVRLPPLVGTIAVAIPARLVMYIATNDELIKLKRIFDLGMKTETVMTTAIVIICAMLAAAFAMVRFSRLGVPMHERPIPKGRHAVFFASYMVAALFAGIAGVYLLARYGIVYPGGTAIVTTEFWFVLFVLTSSRKIDNKWAPALWAMLAAVVFTLIRLALFIKPMSVYATNDLLYSLPIPFLFASVKANRDALKRMCRFE